jgi:hypothetical protein
LKISKTSWLILSAGIFIVVITALGLTRSQQLKEQSQLDEELSVAEMRLGSLEVKQLRQQHDELLGRLDESNVQLTMAKDGLRQTVESIDVTDEFFKIAQSCDVEISSITTSGIQIENLEAISCAMITLGAVVKGEVPNIINFVISLNSDFTTGVVKSVQISIPNTADEKDSTINMQMVVYAYKGD